MVSSHAQRPQVASADGDVCRSDSEVGAVMITSYMPGFSTPSLISFSVHRYRCGLRHTARWIDT